MTMNRIAAMLSILLVFGLCVAPSVRAAEEEGEAVQMPLPDLTKFKLGLSKKQVEETLEGLELWPPVGLKERWDHRVVFNPLTRDNNLEMFYRDDAKRKAAGVEMLGMEVGPDFYRPVFVFLDDRVAQINFLGMFLPSDPTPLFAQIPGLKADEGMPVPLEAKDNMVQVKGHARMLYTGKGDVDGDAFEVMSYFFKQVDADADEAPMSVLAINVPDFENILRERMKK